MFGTLDLGFGLTYIWTTWNVWLPPTCPLECFKIAKKAANNTVLQWGDCQHIYTVIVYLSSIPVQYCTPDAHCLPCQSIYQKCILGQLLFSHSRMWSHWFQWIYTGEFDSRNQPKVTVWSEISQTQLNSGWTERSCTKALTVDPGRGELRKGASRSISTGERIKWLFYLTWHLSFVLKNKAVSQKRTGWSSESFQAWGNWLAILCAGQHPFI